MNVSVVVPAFNNWTLTKACIDTLRSVTSAQALADVTVVDDGSTDGVSAAWAGAQSNFRPLLLPHNRGFSHACNAGAGAGMGAAILFLNNDAFVTPGSIEAMVATLAAQPSIGIVGAKLVYTDGSLQHAGLALLDGAVSRWWHVHRQQPGSFADANVPRDMLAVTGAALLIRRPLFAALGGFDAGFINGWEDVDLCLRAWSRGARVRYEPGAVIEHLESATLGRVHDDRANERRFIDRWAATLAAAPRYPLAEIPPIALAKSRTPVAVDDSFAGEQLGAVWNLHFGAKVSRTRAGSRIDRLKIELSAALAKRRPTLEISWAGAALERSTGPARVAYVAPMSAEEAGAYTRASDIAAWWTPTAASRSALIAADAPPQRVSLMPLGASAAGPTLRTGPLVVAARADSAAVLHALARVNPEVRTLVLRAGGGAGFGAIDIVIAGNGGDPWGLLVASALVHGCHVVATPPVDAFVARMAGINVVDTEQVLVTVRALSSNPAAVRAQSFGVALAARRRLDPLLATQRAAEAARALVHGTPSSALVEVGPALAANLRRATVKAGTS